MATPKRVMVIRLFRVIALATGLWTATGSVAGAQVNCSAYGANPNDDSADDSALQLCFDSAPSGGTVYLDPGSPGFLVDSTVTINKPLTITSSQAPTRATILAGHNLSNLMMQQP